MATDTSKGNTHSRPRESSNDVDDISSTRKQTAFTEAFSTLIFQRQFRGFFIKINYSLTVAQKSCLRTLVGMKSFAELHIDSQQRVPSARESQGCDRR